MIEGSICRAPGRPASAKQVEEVLFDESLKYRSSERVSEAGAALAGRDRMAGVVVHELHEIREARRRRRRRRRRSGRVETAIARRSRERVAHLREAARAARDIALLSRSKCLPEGQDREVLQLAAGPATYV